MAVNIHATTVTYKHQGILILGHSGSGKSDLALRLIMNKQAVLVADDRTELRAEKNRLVAQTPETIKGLLEVRGVGVIKFPFETNVKVALAIELVKSRDEIERLPDDEFYEIENIKIPLIKLYAFEPSAPDKVIAALLNK